MHDKENTVSKLPRGWGIVLALIAFGFLVWIFTTANPWLIAPPVIVGLLALIGYVLHQRQQTRRANQPHNIISLERELRAREEQALAIKKQEILSSVLVVEDNPVALKTLSRLFSALGAQSVTEATSAEQALELMQRHKITFILTDYRLGGMSGVQLLEKIRGAGDQTPVIILSATPDQTGVLRTASFDRTDFFGKPLRRDELTNAINRLSSSI